LDVAFYKLKVDWSKPNEKGRFTRERVNARECEERDFAASPREAQIYKRWIGFSLICPDLEDSDDFFIQGDASSVVTQSLEFSIQRCNATVQK